MLRNYSILDCQDQRGEPWGACAPARGQQGGTGDPGEENNALLGNTTKFVVKPVKGRLQRYILQAAIAEILPGERVSWCLRRVRPEKELVDILYSAERKKAHYGNLMVCGSAWLCPICSAKIAEVRKAEVNKGLAEWTGGSLMVAFTCQHGKNDRLKDTRALMTNAYRKMQQDRSWGDLKASFEVVGQITSQEVTWGAENGWHPHKHTLMLTKNEILSIDLLVIEEKISKIFRKQVDLLGGYAHPEYGVKVTMGDAEIMADYVGKGTWGAVDELTKGAVKRGREGNLSPFEVAWWAGTGDPWAKFLFQEYAAGMKGVKQLVFSKGLRRLLNLQKDRKDQEISEIEEIDTEILARLGRDVWSMICLKGLRGHLLEVADQGETDKIFDYLNQVFDTRFFEK